MTDEIENQPDVIEETPAERRLRYRRTASRVLFVIAGLTVLGALQAWQYYSRYQTRIDAVNAEMYELMTEKTLSGRQQVVQDRFRNLMGLLKDDQEFSFRIKDQYETLAEHFREAPVATSTDVLEQFRLIVEDIGKPLPDGSERVLAEGVLAELQATVADMETLIDIYTVPYEELQADLENPPLYLWPTSALIERASGFGSAVLFNRAMYLAQIGEMGTARVLLTGLHASADNSEIQGLIYYGLGRLQWELFLARAEPENYFQAAKYLRQSMQADPEASLPKRLFDYMLSLTQAESTPGAGKGDPTTLTEGEAGAVSEGTPMF